MYIFQRNKKISKRNIKETKSIKILGFSAYYHDSAAALIINGEIISAVQKRDLLEKKTILIFLKNLLSIVLKRKI